MCAKSRLWGEEFTEKANRMQIPLDPTNYPLWGATAYLPANITFQYKFLRKESNGTVRFFFSPLTFLSEPPVCETDSLNGPMGVH
jgi:Starch binding domain